MSSRNLKQRIILRDKNWENVFLGSYEYVWRSGSHACVYSFATNLQLHVIAKVKLWVSTRAHSPVKSMLCFVLCWCELSYKQTSMWVFKKVIFSCMLSQDMGNIKYLELFLLMSEVEKKIFSVCTVYFVWVLKLHARIQHKFFSLADHMTG